MSNTEKGTLFEDIIFKEVNRQLKSGGLALIPELCSVHQKKRYFSNVRKGDIEMDISIEIKKPGADDWSSLWLWECKTHKHPIYPRDVEAFDSQINQIGGSRAQGFFATTSALTKQAQNVADSFGIAILRKFPDGNMIYNSYFDDSEVTIPSSKYEYKRALSNPDYKPQGNSFFSVYKGQPYYSMKDLLIACLSET